MGRPGIVASSRMIAASFDGQRNRPAPHHPVHRSAASVTAPTAQTSSTATRSCSPSISAAITVIRTDQNGQKHRTRRSARSPARVSIAGRLTCASTSVGSVE